MRKLSRLIWVILGALTMRACVLEPVRLTDESMVPVASESDTVLVSKLYYGLRIPGSGVMLLDWKDLVSYDAPIESEDFVIKGVDDRPLVLSKALLQ